MSSPLREVFAQFGIEVDDKKLGDADKKVEDFIGQLGKLGRVLVGGAAAYGVMEFAKNISETGDQLDKAAIRLGIGTDALQSLAFAADQSGAGIDQLTVGLLMLQDKVGDALINTTGEGAKAFAKYGIAIKDAHGNVKDADEVFASIAERMAKTKSEAEKVTIATDLFGRQGRALVPLLKEGAGGIAELRAQFKELGGGFSKDAVKASRDYNDALGRFGVTVQSIKGRIAVVLLPVLQRFVDAASKGVAVLLELSKNSSIVQTTLGILAAVLGALALKMALAFAPMIAAVAGIAVLVLLVEDIVTLFQGGQSVVGAFIDKLFGVGTAAKVVEKLKDTFGALLDNIKDTIAAFQIWSKLKEHRDLNDNDLRAMERLGFDVGGVAHGRAGRTDAEQQVVTASKNGQVFIPKGYTKRDVDQFLAPNNSRTLAEIHQQNTIVVNGAGNPKDVADEVDRKLKQKNKEAHDALIKRAEPVAQ